jgi:hypothetical protein
MRIFPVFFAVLLSLACVSGEDSCFAGATDRAMGVGVAVESCASIGTYSIGGLYNGQWDKLTFQYPNPWKGTFTTFRIDGDVYCTSENPRNCTLTDQYVTEKPNANGKTVEAAWTLPNATVKQTFRLVENKTIIYYDIRNTDSRNHTYGLRLHVDTMLGVNDGAPIYVPGDGLKTNEVEYSGGRLNFGYWKAYNRPEEPTIVSTGTIDPKSRMTYPTRVVVADWKRSKDTAWDYEPTGRIITGDSAVLMYYDLGTIVPGEQKTVVMSYGSEAPVLRQEQGQLGVTEITLSTISGEYCPNEEAQFKVDVLSAGTERTGAVGLTVEQAGTAYYSDRKDATFPKDQVRTLDYKWLIPANATGKFTIKATLYNGTAAVETREKPDEITVDAGRCASTVVKVGTAIVGGTLFAAVIAAIGLAAAAAWYLWLNRGSVGFTKFVEGENVSVVASNNTQKVIKDVVIEDTIPAETEMRVHTLNALRRQNSLIWEVGRLRPGETATLEYWISGGRAMGGSTLTWDKGSKTLK